MSTVCCYDVQGNPVYVASDSVTYCLASYGIMIEHNQVLLERNPHTELWHPPGKILVSGEIPAQAVGYHFRQLTGVMPELGPLLFLEDHFRIDEAGKAWHMSLMYYAVQRQAIGDGIFGEVDDDSQPDFVPLAELRRDEMQFGYQAVQAGRLRLML